MKPLAILGLDPGTTSAYALLDLEGKVIKIHSAKNQPVAEVISQVFALAQPIIVGTDKAKVPSFVQSCARQLGMVVVHPPEDLLREEKRLLFQGYSQAMDNHEKDGLAAALFAWKQFLPRLQKISHYLQQHPKVDGWAFTKRAILDDLHFQAIDHLLQSENQEKPFKNKEQPSVKKEPSVKKQALPKALPFFQQQKEKDITAAIPLQTISLLQQEIGRLRQSNRLLLKKGQHTERRIQDLFQHKEQRLKVLHQLLQNKDQEQARLEQAIQEL